MKILTRIVDELGNLDMIPVIQGESRQVSVFFLKPDGTPYVYTATPAEILVKVFSDINQASIQKSLGASQITLISVTGGLSGIIGIQFKLLPADTVKMAANNSGLPFTIKLTDNASNVLELDVPGTFSVSLPLIQT